MATHSPASEAEPSSLLESLDPSLPLAAPEVDPWLDRRNAKHWFPAMERLLDSFGVRYSVSAREPSLLADLSNAAECRQYSNDCSLASLLLHQHVGVPGRLYLALGDPRVSWARLKSEYIEPDFTEGVRLLQHWMSCRYEEGMDMDKWTAKMSILRRKVEELQGNLITPRLARDVVLANLPERWRAGLDVPSASETRLSDIVRQLTARYRRERDNYTVLEPPPPPAPASMDVLDSDQDFSSSFERLFISSTSPSPSSSSPSPAKLHRLHPTFAPPFVDEPSPISNLPPELIFLICSFELPPAPLPPYNNDVATVSAETTRQSRRAELRATSRLFAYALGPPTTFAVRSVGKLQRLIREMQLYPERQSDVKTLILFLHDRKVLPRQVVFAGDAALTLFKMCNRIKVLRIGGTELDVKEDWDATLPDGTLRTLADGTVIQRRGNKVEAVLSKARICLPDLTELSTLGADEVQVHASRIIGILDSFPHLEVLSLGIVRDGKSTGAPMLPLRLKSLSLYGNPSRTRSQSTHWRILERLSESGALSSLSVLRIHIHILAADVPAFTKALLPVVPYLESFTALDIMDNDRSTTAPTTFDQILTRLDSVLAVSLGQNGYSTLSFIRTLPSSCRKLELVGPDSSHAPADWGWSELGKELAAVSDDPRRVEPLDITVILDDADDATEFFLAALLLVLAAHAPARVAALNPGNGTLGTFSWDTTDFIFAFGDSYSSSSWLIENGVMSPDEGHTSSGGPSWIQQLAYHQDEKKRLLRNFAANGASIDNALVAISEHETGVAQQLPKFEQHFTPSPEFFHWESTNTLFSIFVGINDCDLSFHWEVDQTEWHAREFRTWTTLQERLYAVGARHFLFMTVPPMHASPGYWGEGKLKDSIEDYNLHLRMSAAAFQDAHSDAVVLLHDMYTTFGQLLDNAPLLGFKVTDAPCKSYAPTGTHPTLVAHPDCVYPLSEYFWKDSLHPSWPVHQLMAERVKGETLSVPEWVEGSQMRANVLGGGLR